MRATAIQQRCDSNPQGTPFEDPLWRILLHVVNHRTQFRSEAAAVLTTFGAS